MVLNLAGQLRASTASLHTTVERSDFMRAMLGGLLDKASYCLLLRNLYPIYQALEKGVGQWCDHPSIVPIWTPRLSRVGALCADLNVLHGADWASEIEVLPASEAYVLRLQSFYVAQPDLLVAHAYVRYLGDLSGGRILEGVISRSLCLSNTRGAGLDFYHFGNPEDTADLAQMFRAGLNLVTQDANCADAIAKEAVSAFGLHADLFQQLEAVRTKAASARQPSSMKVRIPA